MIVDLEKTADENLEALVMNDEPGPSIKFVHIDIYINLLPATDAHQRWRYATATDAHKQRRYAIDHVESLTWKSSHLSGESPTLCLELEKNEPSHCHELARLPMPTSGGGTPYTMLGVERGSLHTRVENPLKCHWS